MGTLKWNQRYNDIRFAVSGLVKIASVGTSLLSITWAIVSSRRWGYKETTILRLVIDYLGHLFVIGARVLAIALFTVQFQFWLVAVVAYHCLVITITSLHNRTYLGKDRYLFRLVDIMTRLALNMFCVCQFRKGNVGHRKRHYRTLQYIVFHCILYTENIVMAVLCYTDTTTEGSWYRIPCIVIIFLGYIVGFSFQMIFHLTFHPEASDGEEIEYCVLLTDIKLADKYMI